jgi:hypothetical protein
MASRREGLTVMSRANVIPVLAFVMIASLALAIVIGAVALIWNGQPFGNEASTVADVFATIFSVSFFAAFVLAMIEQRSRQTDPAPEHHTHDH